MKYDARQILRLLADRSCDMIGDRLALAVLVRREVNLIRLFGERLYLLYDLIVIGADFIFGLEAFIFDFNAEFFLRQIADVSLGSDDVVVIA